MGIDATVLDFAMKFKGKIKGNLLQLGRQGIHFSADQADAIIKKYDPSGCFAQVSSETGFAETLFKYLGADQVTALDASNYEGAELVHDLNIPVPEMWRNTFDCIFDGGTLEHVFNAPVAFENVRKMLKPGGLFLSVTPANNFLGHGFYQFSPELLWRVFARPSGCIVELMQIALVSSDPKPVDMPDPAAEGRRIEIGSTSGPTYLLAAVKKLEDISSDNVLQSDYFSKWKETEVP